MSSNVGERIQQRREELGFSLSYLSELSGVSKSALWDLENKPKTRPSAERLYKIAWALRCRIEDLLGLPVLPAPGSIPSRVYDDLERAQKAIRQVKKLVQLDDMVGCVELPEGMDSVAWQRQQRGDVE